MSEKLNMNYFLINEFAKQPYRASKDATGYDVFAATAKTLLWKTCNSIELELRISIPPGHFEKLFSRSGLLRDHFITCEVGVVDADYRGSVLALLINHHPYKPFTVPTGNKLVQIVFMKKFDVEIEQVSGPALLGKTRRGARGFKSSGSWGAIPFKTVSPMLRQNEIFVVSDDGSNESDE